MSGDIDYPQGRFGYIDLTDCYTIGYLACEAVKADPDDRLIVNPPDMKHETSRYYEVMVTRPRTAGVGAALRSMFSETSGIVPMDFEVLLAELDARTRCRT